MAKPPPDARHGPKNRGATSAQPGKEDEVVRLVNQASCNLSPEQAELAGEGI
jgi:hypothetical protein